MADNASILLGSALAGFVARCTTHPLDTAKAKIQVQTEKGLPQFRSSYAILSATLKSEGVAGMYRGLGVALVGSAPAVCAYIASYEKCKDVMLTLPGGQHTSWVHLVSGFVAEAASCSLWVPIDVIKERLQVQTSIKGATKYGGSWDAFKRIHQREGVMGFYRGYGSTLLAFGPFSALYFVFYEKAKQFLSGEKDEASLSFLDGLACASSSAALAAWCTTPLDVVKLRIQVARSLQDSTKFNYTGALNGLTRIVRDEGPLALFRGAGARMLFQVPATAITMASFDWFRPRLRSWLSCEDGQQR